MMDNEKRSIGVAVFGVIFIIMGLFVLLMLVEVIKNYRYILSIRIEYFYYWVYFISFIILTLIFSGTIFIICGIGVLRLKFWARYIIIALMLSSLMSPLNEALIFGNQSLNAIEILTQIAIVSFVLWFFMRKKIKKQFGDGSARFRLKTKYGAVICAIIFLALVTPVSTLAFKIYSNLKYKEPFFVPKLQTIRLQENEEAHLLEKYRRIELFNTSILIPKNFIIIGLIKSQNKSSYWNAFIGNSADVKKGLIIIENKGLYETMKGLYEKMGLKNTYEFQRVVYTNNWSPISITLRNLLRQKGKIFKIEQFDTNRLNGFIKSTYDESEILWTYEISFYSKDDKTSRNIIIRCKEGNFNKANVLNIVSSVALLSETRTEAGKYYKEGLDFLNSNDFIEAQFKFANAYYLDAEKPEYGFMLAKALLKNGEVSFGSAKLILGYILKLKPDYKEARELLEEIRLKSSNN